MTDRFDHRPNQVTHGVHQVDVCLAVGGRVGRGRQVGGDVIDRSLEPVEPVVESIDVGHHYDALPIRDVEFIGPPPGLIGPLAVGRATEQPRPTDTRSYVERTMAPAAPQHVRRCRHLLTVRRRPDQGG